MPLINKLLASGADGAKVTVKTKIAAKVGQRKKKLRTAFGQGGA